MNVVTRISDKAGSLGSIVSAMGCGACFPALASLGAAAHRRDDAAQRSGLVRDARHDAHDGLLDRCGVSA
jgi:hypothetical protein